VNSVNNISKYKEEIDIMQQALKTKIQDMLVKNHYVKLEEKKDSEIDIESEITNVEQPRVR
jgi:hypothetical protein